MLRGGAQQDAHQAKVEHGIEHSSTRAFRRSQAAGGTRCTIDSIQCLKRLSSLLGNKSHCLQSDIFVFSRCLIISNIVSIVYGKILPIDFFFQDG